MLIYVDYRKVISYRAEPQWIYYYIIVYRERKRKRKNRVCADRTARGPTAARTDRPARGTKKVLETGNANEVVASLRVCTLSWLCDEIYLPRMRYTVISGHKHIHISISLRTVRPIFCANEPGKMFSSNHYHNIMTSWLTLDSAKCEFRTFDFNIKLTFRISFRDNQWRLT